MLSLLKQRSFVLIWLGQCGFGLGSTFAAFVVSWVLYDITGSEAAMGGVWFVFFLTSTLSFLIAGPYIDKYEHKKVLVFSEWGRATIFLSIALAFHFNILEIWMLYVGAMMIGIVEPVYRPASMAYIAKVVPKENLLKANSVLDGTTQLMNLIGPLLSGLLIGLVGADALLTGLVCILGITGGLLCLLPRTSLDRNKSEEQSWLEDFKEGLNFYRITPILLWMGLLVMWINFSFGAFQSMVFPYVLDHLNGDAFRVGLFNTMLALGMLGGAIWLGASKDPKKLRNVMIGAVILQGVFLVSLGWITNYWFALIAIAIIGITLITFNANNATLYQKKVPKHLQGRVFTLRMLFAQSGLPVGAGIGGLFAEVWGFTVLFSILGLSILIISLIAWNLPIFKELNKLNNEEQPKTEPYQKHS